MMLSVPVFALIATIHGPPADSTSPARLDTLRARQDSIAAARKAAAAERRKARIIPLTPALQASAFRDSIARRTLARARQSRQAQDQSLTSYEATTYERLSTGLRVGSLGRKRLLFRNERAGTIQWERGKGAITEITGRRVAAPMFDDGDGDVTISGDNRIPIPYVPGQEALMLGSDLARFDVEDNEIIHPLANGAEAYYTYATGDSAAFQLPGNRRVVVRELRVQPRRPSWNVIVGSLWFDATTGQLVRAVYRLAETLDVVDAGKEITGEDLMKEIPRIMRPMILPISVQLSVITVDYGLYENRFWLPRSQRIEGSMRMGVFRIPAELEQSFEYARVNGTLDLPNIDVEITDTSKRINAYAQRRKASHDACRDSTGYRIVREMRYDNTVPVLIRVPCNSNALAVSPTLPPTSYATVDTIFGDAERDRLIREALSMDRQAGMVRMPAKTVTGLRAMRYNRVEGLSLGATTSRVLGGGYQSHLGVRFGTADLQPSVELALDRSDGRRTRTVRVYRRLVANNDWDNPLSLSASLSAILFGRDQGLYYRAWGGELTSNAETGARPGIFDHWRLFAEQQWSTRTYSTFSLPRLLRGKDDFSFRPNMTAEKATAFGLQLRRRWGVGEDPEKLRLYSDIRAEGAIGTFDYVRGMIDLTLSRPFGPIGSSLTVSSGMSGGTLPVQRLWYLGGSQTLPGHPIAQLAGNAYWLTRLELGTNTAVARPILFGTLGWAGDRTKWTENVVPAGSAGVGVSLLDGVVRFDLAKGIRPERGIRGYLYLDATF